jgi:competence protein ComFC
LSKSWRIKYHLYRLFWLGVDLLYPPICGGCEKKGERWCEDCRKTLTLISGPKCSICGLPEMKDEPCFSCQQSPPFYKTLRSWVVFEGPVRKAVHRIKYRQDLGLGDALATEMQDYAGQLKWDIDIVVPVPLGKKRFRERGYNQVGLFAHPLALAQEWIYAPHALKRVRETVSQVGLSADERENNVRSAFVANHNKVAGKKVLVIDDVSTTGATLNSCAEALIKGGAQEVYALSLARALPHHGLKTV